MAAKTWSMTTPADDVLKSAVPGLIRDVKEHVQIAGGFYAEQQTVPDQTIAIYAGVVFFQGVKVEYAGLDVVDLGTSGDFEVSALTADYYNKILFSIDSTGTLNATEGTEHSVLASVVEPTLPEGEFPICMVSVQDDGTGTAGTINDIVQDDIQQLQGFSNIGSNISDTAYNESTWDGVTTIAPSKNAVRDEFETKQDTITGAATTIVSDDLTASRALVANASGKVAVSATTLAELAYVSGVTSAIQTQLCTKLNIADDRVVKGWGKVQGTGTAAITNDFNILSITDNGTGNYTITIDTDLANANYAVVTGLDGTVGFVYFDTFAVGSFVARTHNAAAANTDRDFFFIIFGN